MNRSVCQTEQNVLLDQVNLYDALEVQIAEDLLDFLTKAVAAVRVDLHRSINRQMQFAAFGLGVPEERAQFKSGPTLNIAVSSGTLLSGFPLNEFPSREPIRTYGETLFHQRTSGRNRVLF